jgi:hypothetical protein
VRKYLLKWGPGLEAEVRACAKRRGVPLAVWLREAATEKVTRELRQDPLAPSELEQVAERAAASLRARARAVAGQDSETTSK